MKLLNQKILTLVQNVAEHFADLKVARLRKHLDWSRHEADGKIRRVPAYAFGHFSTPTTIHINCRRPDIE